MHRSWDPSPSIHSSHASLLTSHTLCHVSHPPPSLLPSAPFLLSVRDTCRRYDGDVSQYAGTEVTTRGLRQGPAASDQPPAGYQQNIRRQPVYLQTPTNKFAPHVLYCAQIAPAITFVVLLEGRNGAAETAWPPPACPPALTRRISPLTTFALRLPALSVVFLCPSRIYFHN